MTRFFGAISLVSQVSSHTNKYYLDYEKINQSNIRNVETLPSIRRYGRMHDTPPCCQTVDTTRHQFDDTARCTIPPYAGAATTLQTGTVVMVADSKPDPQFRRGDRSISGIGSIGDCSRNGDGCILFHVVIPTERRSVEPSYSIATL